MPLRLGLGLVRGLANDHGAQIVAARGDTPYASIDDVRRRSGVPLAALERLAEADAFAGLGVDRRQALWQVKGLGHSELPLFAAVADREPAVALQPMTDGREVVEDYRAIQLSLRAHPLSFLRAELQRRGITACADLDRIRDGQNICVAGIVLVRQKPGKGNVTFITLEDETGIANAILWQRVFEHERRTVMSAAMLAVHGTLQREGKVIHIVTDRLEDYTPLLRRVGDMQFPHTTGRGDGAKHGGSPDRGDLIRVKSRDFH